MIDLKKEIEKRLENAKNDYSEYPVLSKNDITLGKCKAYQDCLDVINNYNIITAPKTIKLSEIVDRLKETIKEKISIDDGYRCEKAIGYYTRCWEDWDFIEIVGFDKDMKITQVGVCYERFEWLYALWIAGTIIEDDLQEE